MPWMTAGVSHGRKDRQDTPKSCRFLDQKQYSRPGPGLQRAVPVGALQGSVPRCGINQYMHLLCPALW